MKENNAPTTAQVLDAAIDNTSMKDSAAELEYNRVVDDLHLTNTFFPRNNDASVVYDASWAVEYKNLKDLYLAADDIIIADVTGISKEYQPELVPYTDIDVTIVKSLKGILTEGATAAIVQTGSAEKYFSIDGVPLLQHNMKVILFVKISENGKLSILNSYAGKYFIDKDANITYSGNFTSSKHIEIRDIEPGTSLQSFLTIMDTIKTSNK